MIIIAGLSGLNMCRLARNNIYISGFLFLPKIEMQLFPIIFLEASSSMLRLDRTGGLLLFLFSC